jgi:hypothetical protein
MLRSFSVPRLLAFCLHGSLRAGLFLAFLATLPQPLRAVSPEPRPWILADVDGDYSPDLVEGRSILRDGEWQISAIHVGQDLTRIPSSQQFLHRLRLIPRDLDDDTDLDLIVYRDFGSRPVGIWVNDGKGNFRPGDMSILSPEPDCAHHVAAVSRASAPQVEWHNGRRAGRGIVGVRYRVSLSSDDFRGGFCTEQRVRRLPYQAASGLSPPRI